MVVLATNEGGDPTAIRIRNVTVNGFEAVQVESASADGLHSAMTMHYLAIEPGTHELPDGTRVLAGTAATSQQQHGQGVAGTEGWHDVTFSDWPGVGASSSQVFTYDANGNRTSITENGTPFAYTNASASNRLLSTAGPVARSYVYDLAGNIISDGIHTYGYDDRGRLVNVDAGAATYGHNALGQRVSKTVGSESTFFAYDEYGNLIGEYGIAGAPRQEHVWFDGAPVAVIDGADLLYVHTDHLGSPRAITDFGTTVWTWDSDPFGSTQAQDDPDGDSTSIVYRLRFPGQYWDAETDMHYNYFRTYDPSTGRYLESDPIGLAGGPNTYGYVLQNPLSNIDPDGRLVWLGVPVYYWAIGGGAAAAGAWWYYTNPWSPVRDDTSRPNLPTSNTPPLIPPLETPESQPFPIPLTDSAIMEAEQCEDDEDKCEKQAEQDERMCRMMTIPGTGPRGRCWASVQERYGACRAGRPLPPLVYW